MLNDQKQIKSFFGWYKILPKFPIWRVNWNRFSSIKYSFRAIRQHRGALQRSPTLNPGFKHTTMCNQIISCFSFLNCYKIPGKMMADDSWQSLVSQLTAPKDLKSKKYYEYLNYFKLTCIRKIRGFRNVLSSKIPLTSLIEQTSLGVCEATQCMYFTYAN